MADTPDLLPTGTMVTIPVKGADDFAGIIAGHATVDHRYLANGTQRFTSAYIVALDEGFYTPDGMTFISALMIHPDNLLTDAVSFNVDFNDG